MPKETIVPRDKIIQFLKARELTDNNSIPNKRELQYRLNNQIRHNLQLEAEQRAEYQALLEQLEQDDEQHDVSHILNKFVGAALIKEKAREQSTGNGLELAFVDQDTFEKQGTIKIYQEDNAEIQLSDDYEKEVAKKLDDQNLSSGRTGVQANIASGAFLAENISRTQSIGGNKLVSLGTTNDLTEHQMAGFGVAAIEGAVKNPESTKIVLDGFSEQLSQTMAEGLVQKGFKAENISATNMTPNLDDSQTDEMDDVENDTPKFNPTPFSDPTKIS